MDLATLIGLIGALVTIGLAILFGGVPGAFVDPASITIVGVSTVLVTLIKFSTKQFLGATKVAYNAFMYKVADPEDLINETVELANQARSRGTLALEGAEVNDPFLKKAIDLLVDGYEPDVVESILAKDLNQTVKRHKDGQAIFKAIGEVAPAMGMIGTLIGLVQMLSAMDDPKQIGPAMAVALLTTLYGAIIANMIALPIANKLELRSADEQLTKSMIIDAVLSIQVGQNPRVIRDILKNYLPRSQREPKEKAA